MIIGDFNDRGLPHSYPNTPPGVSEPQFLYHYHYEGWVSSSAQAKGKPYIWNIEPPFYIVGGQGTSGITCELRPVTTNLCIFGLDYETTSADCLEIPTTHSTKIYMNSSPNLSYRGNQDVIVSHDEHKFYAHVASYNKQTGQFILSSIKNVGTGTFCSWNIRLAGNENYSNITLQLGKWNEGTAVYYKSGPKWRIEGNMNPKVRKINNKIVQSTETYTLIPEYDMSGNPPRCATDPNNYQFNIKNGKIVTFRGGIPPHENPQVDIFWHQTGSTYFSFYSSWANEETTFPTTIDIYVSETTEPITITPIRTENGEKKLWINESRPNLINSNSSFFYESEKIPTPSIFTLELNLKETINSNFPIGWKIVGNNIPTIKMQNNKNLQEPEIYTLVPSFDNKLTQLPNEFYINTPKGKINNFHLNTDKNIILEIIWLETGSTFISFYTKWKNEIINQLTQTDIYIKKEDIIPIPIPKVKTTSRKLWTHQQRPTWTHGNVR